MMTYGRANFLAASMPWLVPACPASCGDRHVLLTCACHFPRLTCLLNTGACAFGFHRPPQARIGNRHPLGLPGVVFVRIYTLDFSFGVHEPGSVMMRAYTNKCLPSTYALTYVCSALSP